jgi:hypothetical protein
MTTPVPQEVPPFDQGNALLGETPAQMSASLIGTPVGQRLALTIRTPSTTLTVLLAGKDAQSWAAMLTKTADMMSASGLIVAGPGAVPNGKAAP